MDYYYVSKDGISDFVAQYTLEEIFDKLLDGQISKDYYATKSNGLPYTELLKVGGIQWQKISELFVTSEKISSANNGTNLNLTLNQHNKKSSSNLFLIIIASLFIVSLILSITNPSIEDYRSYCNKIVENVYKNSDIPESNFTDVIKNISVQVFINSTERSNYYIFSVYTTNINGNIFKRYGILGNFFDQYLFAQKRIYNPKIF